MIYIYTVISLIALLNCSNKTRMNREVPSSLNVKNDLILSVNFSDSLNIPKGFDTINWDEYNIDEESFNYLLKVTYKDSLSCNIQIPLVATRIPFLFKLNRIDNNRLYINAIQQFNTVWGDSLIFELQGNKYNIKEAFRRCYRGDVEAFPMKIMNEADLIILE